MATRLRLVRLGTVPAPQPRFTNPPLLITLVRHPVAGYAWFLLRVAIGWQWLSAGWHKLAGPSSIGWIHDGQSGDRFVARGESILAFWQRAVSIPEQGRTPITYGWYRDFLHALIDHEAHSWFAYLIAGGEFLVGVCLVLGAFTALAALGGAFLNFNYMLAGSADANPVLFLSAVLLILAWRVAGYVGLDRWILPLIGTPWQPGRLWRRRTDATGGGVDETRRTGTGRLAA
jgi:thiosulfate dehydrogenase [quinone] large subunit